ncbi:transcription termination factor Rho [Amygdalobacter nucleatus]|uniref:transcription termination factor Rho n=1 Tax=Amygdalobacter nucleatus TaxID=3029274 RepID=UPI0027A08CFF|nr:transcription termination factor Rho [Amygdalobacter nucleatus]WEG37331.1 transcription termination factor Rho [Amygdalobacter nucleatus]
MVPIFYSELSKETLVKLIVQRKLMQISKAMQKKRQFLMDLLIEDDRKHGYKTIVEANQNFEFTPDTFSKKPRKKELAAQQVMSEEAVANLQVKEQAKNEKKVTKLSKEKDLESPQAPSTENSVETAKTELKDEPASTTLSDDKTDSRPVTKSKSANRQKKIFSKQRLSVKLHKPKQAEVETEDKKIPAEDKVNTQAETAESNTAEAVELEQENEKELEKRELVGGILNITPDGYGFLRTENYNLSANDYFVSPQLIRRFNLREGDEVHGFLRKKRGDERFQAINFIKDVNGFAPEKLFKRPQFARLVPIYTQERYTLETTSTELSTRIIDLVCPIGKGQRGMIVSPPKAGKTILLQKIADAISRNNPEAHLIVLLIDERPEEVTDMQRRIRGEVVYSTFDQTAENHVRITELVLERAKRLVELGEDVVILLDSITRLARAYNLTINPTGRTLSGGLDPGSLHGPKRFFGAARKIENGGSLTIVATALVETGSRMDEVIFEEFKGTGNMEVYLDRKLSEKRIFPAIDINRSGTRREELLLNERELDAVWSIRKAMGRLDTASVTELIINFMQKTKNNAHFVECISMSLNDKDVIDSLIKKNANNKANNYQN